MGYIGAHPSLCGGGIVLGAGVRALDYLGVAVGEIYAASAVHEGGSDEASQTQPTTEVDNALTRRRKRLEAGAVPTEIVGDHTRNMPECFAGVLAVRAEVPPLQTATAVSTSSRSGSGIMNGAVQRAGAAPGHPSPSGSPRQ
jgi:hypothetical protein